MKIFNSLLNFTLLTVLALFAFSTAYGQSADFELGGKYQQILTKTTTYTVVNGDDLILADATSAAFTVTLPDPASNQGMKVAVRKNDSTAYVVTVAAATGTIYGQTKLNRQYETAVYVSDGLAGWHQQNWNAIKNAATAITAGATPTLDPRLGNIFTLTPAEAETINLSTAGFVGQEITLVVLTSGTSSYTLTFGTNFKSTGTLATGTTSAKYFLVRFVSDGTNFYEISRTAAQ